MSEIRVGSVSDEPSERRSDHQDYVLGFLFDEPGKRVLLRKKLRPAWMLNKWNGVGGKVAEGEESAAAMEREFEEETDVLVEHWQKVGELSGLGWTVYVYAAYNTWAIVKAGGTASANGEQNRMFNLTDLPAALLPNAAWLIGMALSLTRGETAAEFRIQEVRR